MMNQKFKYEILNLYMNLNLNGLHGLHGHKS